MARKSRKNIDITAVETTPEATHYNAAAYIRLSADAKRKPGDSLTTQRNMIENFIAAAPDINLVQVYTDNNATGTNFDRPAFQRMLADAESGKINCIIVKDLSRFGRNAIDSGYYIEKYLPSLNVRFIAITDDFDSNDGDGGIIIPLKNIMAEAYALDISRKCRFVQKQHIERGLFVGRVPPYGFLLSPDNCHKLVIEEESASVVRKIFEWAAEGLTTGEIARNLNDEGIPSPNKYRHIKGILNTTALAEADKWSMRVIYSIISSRVYLGDMVQGKSKTVNHKDVRVDSDNWICVRNTHDAIISNDLFDRVQILRGCHTHDPESRNSYGAYSSHIFKGKVFCAKCNHIMRRHRQNKDGIYWFRCSSKWDVSRATCTVVSVKEEELKAEIIATLYKQAETLLGGFVKYERDANINSHAADIELRNISIQLGKKGRVLASLYENMLNGTITNDEFIQMKADYKDEIAALSERANELRNSRYDIESEKAEHYDIADAVSAVLADDRLTAEIIDKLADKIFVSPDKSFKIYFKFSSEFAEVS